MSFGVKPFKGPEYQVIRLLANQDVHVSATGANATGEFHTYLRIDPKEILPPQIDFVNIPPKGITHPLVTPFHVHLAVKLPDSIKAITIVDAEGPHHVTIHMVG
jgi:hypothetical protein